MLLTLISLALAYRAAYVEHRAVSPCGSGSCGAAQKRASVSAYKTFLAAAAESGVAILVFPEYGITGFSSYSAVDWHAGGYTETIPWPTHTRTVPCDSPSSFDGAPTLVSLSCAAKEHGVALVANLMDWSDTESEMYNTDIALDTDGAYLAKYRKQNLWGEGNVAVPTDCPVASFSTSFGVTFGLITCADLIYSFPAGALLDRGVRDFVLPAAWSDEMAQMQVMAFAQGWSLRHNASLVVSNHRGRSESGSGIWSAGRPLATTFQPDVAEGSLVVAELPRLAALPAMATPVEARAQSRRNASTASPTVGLPPAFWGVNGSADAAAGERPAGWTFARLDERQLCAGRVCCEAQVTEGSATGYALAALDGADANDGETWAAQVCAVLPCAVPSHECLSYSAPPAGSRLRGVHLSMSGAAAGTTAFPEVVASSSAHEQYLLRPDRGGVDTFDFADNHSAGGSTLRASAKHALTSVVLYGRRFAADTLPYSCSSSSAVPDPDSERVAVGDGNDAAPDARGTRQP